MRKLNTIIYANFSPYENTGHILDFLTEKFTYVFLFSFSFHRFKGKKDTNKLKIYRNGKVLETRTLFDYQIPEKLVFLLLPFRSFFILIQILFYSLYIKSKFGQVDYFFSVNAFTAWVGNTLKRISIVKRTIFWVWDYYPPIHESKIVVFWRWLYWQFDKKALHSNRVFYLNEKLIKLRKRIGELQKDKNYDVIPIGTKPLSPREKHSSSSHLKLAFIGVIKKSQGLDLLFDNYISLRKHFKSISIEIIGEGPDLEYFKKRHKETKINCTFHGLLSEDSKKEEEKIQSIISYCDIGLATYKPEKSNVSYYGDPAKIKRYISCGLPVITTNVFEFAKEIKKTEAGILVKYGGKNQFVNSILKIKNNYRKFKNNAINLSKQYNYKILYQGFLR